MSSLQRHQCYKMYYRTDKPLMKILIITVTFAVKTTIQSFHETLWLIIQYHQTKCWCKRISSSKDKIEMVISGSYKPLLWSWPQRWQSNNFAWHWLMNMHYHTMFGYRRFSGSHVHIKMWTFVVTLTLSTAMQYLHKMHTPDYNDLPSN